MNKVREYLKAWDEADKSGFADEQLAMVENAVAQINDLLDETIVNTQEWKAAEEDLRVALVNVGVIEDTSPTEFDNTLTGIVKFLNDGVNILSAM